MVPDKIPLIQGRMVVQGSLPEASCWLYCLQQKYHILDTTMRGYIVGRGLIKVGTPRDIHRDLFNRKIFKTLFSYSDLR